MILRMRALLMALVLVGAASAAEAKCVIDPITVETQGCEAEFWRAAMDLNFPETVYKVILGTRASRLDCPHPNNKRPSQLRNVRRNVENYWFRRGGVPLHLSLGEIVQRAVLAENPDCAAPSKSL